MTIQEKYGLSDIDASNVLKSMKCKSVRLANRADKEKAKLKKWGDVEFWAQDKKDDHADGVKFMIVASDDQTDVEYDNNFKFFWDVFVSKNNLYHLTIDFKAQYKIGKWNSETSSFDDSGVKGYFLATPDAGMVSTWDTVELADAKVVAKAA